MAFVTEYTCTGCGLELVSEDRMFRWDGESGMTEDFLLLMNICQKLNGAEIIGDVSETYCRDCEKYVKVYSITEALDGIDDPCKMVMEGIRRHIDDFARKLEDLKDIRKRSDYAIEPKENYYVVKIPGYDAFHYSSYLFSEMTREEVIMDALRDFHEEIDEVIESHEKRYQRYVSSSYLVVDDTGRPKGKFDLSEKVKCPECASKINKHVDGKLPCPRCGGSIIGFGICYD